ncbi:hypothetical protein EMMF5_004966 [Cystobasidiomycetes sp. EMM_F5]
MKKWHKWLGLLLLLSPPSHISALPSCTVTSFSAIPAAVANCTSITLQDIAVPGGSSLNLTGLKTGSIVNFAGTTSFGFANASYDMITVSNAMNVTIQATSGGLINGNGQAWNSTIRNLFITSWPVHCFSISGGNHLLFENITLDNRAGDAPNDMSGGLSAAHNSDGFDLSSTNNTILRNFSVYNQDDCVAITSGDNVLVDNAYCSGGHGLSIGSVGLKSNNIVTNIVFQNSVIVDSENGPRIKSNSNATGSVSNITYRSIRVTNISTYGIDIQQDYLNGGPTGNPTNGVNVSNIIMSNITGTAAASALDYYILCGNSSCSNFNFSNVNITGGKITSKCNYGSFQCSP